MKTKKLALSLDELSVESFHTSAGSAAEGTVYGHATILYGCTLNCTADTYDECPTTVDGGTCHGVSCESTCFQRLCTCTNGMDSACDYTCGTCINDCPTDSACMTQGGYQGC